MPRTLPWAGLRSDSRTRSHHSAMPAGPTPEQSEAALESVLDATRALLWIETPQEAASLGRFLVEMLGGYVEVVDPADADVVLDLSFGVGAPVRPAAPARSVARALLDRHLPRFVRDTYRALELADESSRLAEEAAVDMLTGVASRRTLGRTLGRLRPDDTVILIDLDHFKTINDTLGHDEGDRVLAEFGSALNATVRASDRVGRYGGEEFVVVLAGEAEPFLRRFRDEWAARRPHRISFSAGIAAALPNPMAALKAADRAMYRAKNDGRDQWQSATAEDYR